MSDNYFVRAVGTQKTGDSKLMKHEEAMRVLYDEYATILKDLGGEDSIDCAYLDAEKETFEVEDSSGEKYQTMYLLPENKKKGWHIIWRRLEGKSPAWMILPSCTSMNFKIWACTTVHGISG